MPTTAFDGLDTELGARITAIKSRIAGSRVNAIRVQSQSQAMLQTVFCLIGTNDNRLNYRAAEASVKIAEESRRIAEDFKTVAVLTRRDSTDMRIIAAVTLCFLPGTFFATFFSTSFLDFVNDAGVVRLSG
jgi:hypothetical protein